MNNELRFDGRVYKWVAYKRLKSVAEKLAKQYRDRGMLARIVPTGPPSPRGYYIYVKGK